VRASIATAGILCVFSLLIASCGGPSYDPALPDSKELGSPHGYRIARTITHIHTPYSYDACDKNGMPDGKPSQECLNHLRNAFCMNRVDFAFVTDHENHLADYEIPALLLQQPGDSFLTDGSGNPYANVISCPNGFRPAMMTGLEGGLEALGMKSHITGSISDRKDAYSHDDATLRGRLQSEAGALAGVAHTEQWDQAKLNALSPDFIEIYNIHAIIDPKMREKWLGLTSLELIGNILTYMVDPYGDLNADYMFMHFVDVAPVYLKRWDGLYAAGQKVAAIGATDSHENAFSQKASDGERLDSHRRLVRSMSNHVLVNNVTADEIKASIKAGRSWIVFEGFGSPVDFDLLATVGGSTAGVGDTIALSGGSASVVVKAPHLHPASPHVGFPPEIRIELKRVASDGTEAVVAQSGFGMDLTYTATSPGAYRAEVYIIPRHVAAFLSSFSDLANKEYRWIVTNHLYLAP
jgi:hypothetical protein